ncbi:MAG TPA: DUF6794 domain-containing protein [Drouetiella sp.]
MTFLFIQNPSDAARRVYPPSEWWGLPYWSPDGKLLAVQSPPAAKVPSAFKNSAIFDINANPDRQTLILDAKNFSVIAFVGRAMNAAWSPDGKFFAAVVHSPTGEYAAVFEASSGHLFRKLALKYSDCRLAWSPNSSKLAITQKNIISIFDLQSEVESRLPTTDREMIWNLPAWSPDGASIAAFANLPFRINRADRIQIWNSNTLTCTKTLDVPFGQRKHSINRLFWSKDGRKIFLSAPQRIAVFDTGVGAITKTVQGRDCFSLTYSPRGTHLVFRDRDKVRILTPDSLSETHNFQGPQNTLFTFDLSPDEKYLLIKQNKTVAIFQLTTGKAMGYYSWSNSNRARWTPDGKSIVVSGTNLAPRILKVRLSGLGTRSCIEGGHPGAPKWESRFCPANLEQCFVGFDRSLTSKQRDRFKNTKQDDLGVFGGGSILTDSMMYDVYNNWDHFVLEQFFEDKGISDQRDLFDIVLISYWRRLNRKSMDIDAEIKAHRNWWQSRAPAVEENRPLSPDLLDYSAHDEAEGAFTIRSLKSKLKIVSFVSTSDAGCAQQMQVLEKLRKKYPYHDLAFATYIVPPASTAAMQWTVDKHPKIVVDNTAAFLRMSRPWFLVALASDELCKKFVQFQSVTVGKTLGPPQTLVISQGDIVKFRLNGFTPGITEKILESEIDDALQDRIHPLSTNTKSATKTH